VKIAVTAAGQDWSSPLDQRFGRAPFLLVIDTAERTLLPINNRAGMNAAQGAGVQAAQNVIDSRASAVITGHCGPKAFRALRAAGLQVYLAPDGTVADAIARFDSGELRPALAADVDGHW
jgi:predicted Fe-Mo cluster-binding NifX family protein